MTVPSQLDAARLLADLDPPDWLLTHSAAVAEVAAFLATRTRERGHDLATGLPETAALLHDIDKAPPLVDQNGRLGHGVAGAAWLRARAMGELAPSVANHPAVRLTPAARFHEWLRTASISEVIVCYADKRATHDVVPMAGRFAEWQARYPARKAEIAEGLIAARELERVVCAYAAVDPDEVRRQPWVEAALAQVQVATASQP